MAQLDKIQTAAREIEMDDNEKRFNERLGKIAKVKRDNPKAEG